MWLSSGWFGRNRNHIEAHAADKETARDGCSAANWRSLLLRISIRCPAQLPLFRNACHLIKMCSRQRENSEGVVSGSISLSRSYHATSLIPFSAARRNVCFTLILSYCILILHHLPPNLTDRARDRCSAFARESARKTCFGMSEVRGHLSRRGEEK